MHSSISRLIKALSIVIWVLGFIIGFGSGYLGAATSYIYGNQSAFNIWTALLTWLMFFIIGVLYYAFGVLVGTVVNHREEYNIQLRKISEALNRVLTVVEAGPPAPAENRTKFVPLHDPYAGIVRSNAAAQTAPPAPIPRAPEGTAYHKKDMQQSSSSSLICPYCQKEQYSYRSSCLWCGAKFID